ncbi:alpha-amylase family glycosyl hydrolase [Roseitranquillus sediminis]|uniref:alpha-amylase family glycosyl hydrolase n=1 Tax=Roseitranquillus sediminis TaxID=2809051 RepID=UPI001D0CCB10|nr:alpha-amylase family glycosyl hydrolase [Roseitranquillus sediminis]MBM9593837.1 DUF3459 domain-containing protein [Roseitranquillus sediminis]
MASAAGDDWWKRGVIYQIYPRSFQDSDGDGIGDLRGIESRLQHLAELGVDAIWISPIFPSPMADFGYDISDYCGIDPMFGTLEDFDRLLAAAHDRGLRLLLDFVPSHTSDRHPWFEESRASRQSARRDWYVWRDPAPGGGPPNNWLSEFGGPAWSFDEATGQYYLHIYLPQQPALNWRNPDVRSAMLDVLRFWFERGVDGFRVDAAEHLAPDEHLRDNYSNPDWQPHMGPARSMFRTHTAHQPEGHRVVREMRRVADAYPDRVLIGEAYGTIEEVVSYYGPELGGFHLPFNFALIDALWDAAHIAALVDDYEAALPEGAWPNWVLGNHDRARIASRVGPAQARIAAMLLLTLRGTPTIYQGDELGLENADVPPEAVQDPWELNVPGQGLGRDPVRTPMPWDASPGAGFTAGRPWLPISTQTNVAVQAQEPASMLTLHRRLLTLRRAEPALSVGSYRTISAQDDVFVYERRHADRRLVVMLNFSSELRHVRPSGRLVLSTNVDRSEFDGTLLPDEGLVLDES